MRETNGPLNFGTTSLGVGTLTSQVVPILQDYGFCIQLAWTGTPTGTFAVQASCDKGQLQTAGTPTGVTNFTPVSSATASASGAAGSAIINLDAQYYRYFQVVYTGASGSGTLTVAQYNVKGP